VGVAQAYKDRCFGIPKSAGAVASRLTGDDSCVQTNALGSCAMFATKLCAPPLDTDCVDKLITETGSSNPIVAFMKVLLAKKLALITYIVGNVMRLIFFGLGLFSLLPEMPKFAEWGVSVIQDGLCVAAMVLVLQTSFDNDCLEMTFLGSLRSFLALSNYALYFLYYGWFCLLAGGLCVACNRDTENCVIVIVGCIGGIVLLADGAIAWVYSIIIAIYDAASSGEMETLISTIFMVMGLLSGLYPVIAGSSEQEEEEASSSEVE